MRTGMSQFATKSDSYAVGASRDGSIIVGGANIGDPSDRVLHAYRWSSAGEGKDLGTFGGSYGHAAATSSDGSVIVGTATTSKEPIALSVGPTRAWLTSAPWEVT